jgi:hypothetical protein
MPYVDAIEAARAGMLPAHSAAVALALAEIGADDLALINACLEVEQELRERAYATIERLLTYTSMLGGDLDEPLHVLPLPDFADAAVCLFELGWIDRAT